jgi:hypothetical protein
VIQGAAANVYASLTAASDSLRSVQDAWNVPPLDKISPLGRTPVHGTEPSDRDRDTHRGTSPDVMPNHDRALPPSTTPRDTTQPQDLTQPQHDQTGSDKSKTED